jgi:antitoxin component YwqK of YwqJK toxin-antitoxin module
METLRIKEEDLKLIGFDGGGSGMYYYQGKPFTGIMLGYDNGVLYVEREYQNGYEEGWCRYYYKNGQKEEEYKIHNNIIIDGTYKEWGEDGNLID